MHKDEKFAETMPGIQPWKAESGNVLSRVQVERQQKLSTKPRSKKHRLTVQFHDTLIDSANQGYRSRPVFDSSIASGAASLRQGPR